MSKQYIVKDVLQAIQLMVLSKEMLSVLIHLAKVRMILYVVVRIGIVCGLPEIMSEKEFMLKTLL